MRGQSVSRAGVGIGLILLLLTPPLLAQVTDIQTSAILRALALVRTGPGDSGSGDDNTAPPAEGFTSYNDSITADGNRGSVQAHAEARQNTTVNQGTFDLLVSSTGETNIRCTRTGNPDTDDRSGAGGAAGFTVSFTVIQRSSFTIGGTVSVETSGSTESTNGTFDFDGDDSIISIEVEDARGKPRTRSISKSGILEPGNYTVSVSGSSSLGSDQSTSKTRWSFVLLVTPSPAPGPDHNVFTWRSPFSGSFATENRWDPQSVPDGNDIVLFPKNGRYTVDVGTRSSDRAVVRNGSVTFQNATYSLNALSLDERSLSIEDEGLLQLESGSLSAVHVNLGHPSRPNADGSLNVLNPGTQMSISGELRIGATSAGLVSVFNGGRLTSATTHIGSTTLLSRAEVDGLNSQWQTGNLLMDGDFTVLIIKNGGKMASGEVLIPEAISTASLRVDGFGVVSTNVFQPSTWSAQRFTLNDVRLDILKTGTVSAGVVNLGTSAGRRGALNVVGMVGSRFSFLDVAQTLNVGNGGIGELNITDGAFTSCTGDVNVGIGSRGTVVVSGQDPVNLTRAELNALGDLTVGTLNTGVGLLTIKDGARVISETGEVGVTFGSDGGVEITGTGFSETSEWRVRRNLTVGGIASSNGLIAINGGKLNVGGDLNVGPNGFIQGNGTVDVGGTMNVDGFISPGLSPGTLTINGNVVLSSAGTIVAEASGQKTTDRDQLNINGNVTLGGKLVLQFTNGFAPKKGDVFQVLNLGGTATGDFTEITAQGLQAGAEFDAETSNGALSVTALTDTRSLPVVKIRASAPKAIERLRKRGGFVISRTGSTAAPLTVQYSVKGTAENGIDYILLTGEVTIPKGRKTAPIKVTPLVDAENELTETVILKILPGADYTYSLKNSATVKIAR